MLSENDARAAASTAYEYHEAEREKLDVIRRYWTARQRLPALFAADSRRVVRVMARISRVNVLPIVVNSLVQSSYVDGFRAEGKQDENLWNVWQANRMDARQTAIHRAAAAYGVAYTVVLPGELNGEPTPVIRGVSPRSMCALYADDADWPMTALERLGGGLWQLYDEEGVYRLGRDDKGEWTFLESSAHGAPVTPVVRFVDEQDLDVDDEVDPASVGLDDLDTVTGGQIAPLIPIQDQIDLTTFGLQIAQHFGAFKHRYIIGWAADSEQELLKVSADSFLTLDEDPNKVKVGEFSQTDLDGYIKSRQASFRHAATLSQTPIHELTGDLIQMSAEALAAAEAGKDRKVAERHQNWGESHEQDFWLIGHYLGIDVPRDAQVVWRDTSARSFAGTIDALGKLATMLEVPVEELWERIPGVTKQDTERFKQARENAPRAEPALNGPTS